MKIDNTKVYVKKAGKKGRGVFASEPLKRGEVVEVAPIIILDRADSDRIQETQLRNHVYAYGSRSCLGLGYASFYNDSSEPNCRFQVFTDRIRFTALRDIKKNEEILINYGWLEELYEWER